jgi:hypothetical protein
VIDLWQSDPAHYKRCAVCSGIGRKPCVSCNGKGGRSNTRYDYSRDGTSMARESWQPCSACAGTGRSLCAPCRGTGSISIAEPSVAPSPASAGCAPSQAALLARVRALEPILRSTIERCPFPIPYQDKKSWSEQLARLDVTFPGAEQRLLALQHSIADFHASFHDRVLRASAAEEVALSSHLKTMRAELLDLLRACREYWSQRRENLDAGMWSVDSARVRSDPPRAAGWPAHAPVPLAVAAAASGAAPAAPAADPEAVVTCPLCGTELRTKNLVRHFRRSSHPLAKLPRHLRPD